MTGSTIAALARRAAALPRPLLIALDVDGTIAPIVPVPEDARVPPETCAILDRLCAVPRVRVALVTGRDERSLDQVVHIRGAWIAVEHGRRVVRPGGHAGPLRLEPEAARRLEDFHGWAEEHALSRGARIEEKEGAYAIHVRELAERSAGEAQRVLADAARVAKDLGLHVRHGRAVVEAEVHQGDKGRALQLLLRATRAASAIYIGDDVTDHPALRIAEETGGLGIFVRSPERRQSPRAASGSVTGPEQVTLLLAALAGALTESQKRARSRSRGRGSASRS